MKPIANLNLQSYEQVFTEMFYKSTQINAISGYVSEASLADLQYMIRNHTNLKSLNLTVGMARFDGLSVGQIGALRSTHDLLVSNGLGQVLIPTALPVHAKLITFSNPNMKCALVGSSNLSGIEKGFRQYNTDILSDDASLMGQVTQVQESILRISRSLEIIQNEIPTISQGEAIFEGFESVSRLHLPAAKNIGKHFRIPLKSELKSNLNVYFGKGRSGGRLPRAWYEVELIVPISVTRLEGYPQANTDASRFGVVTDDGWKFECIVSGAGSKNLRSYGDLEILGRWIKGRLESAGVLTPGQPVTEEVLRRYGRDYLDLYFDVDSQTWRLDFAADK